MHVRRSQPELVRLLARRPCHDHLCTKCCRRYERTLGMKPSGSYVNSEPPCAPAPQSRILISREYIRCKFRSACDVMRDLWITDGEPNWKIACAHYVCRGICFRGMRLFLEEFRLSNNLYSEKKRNFVQRRNPHIAEIPSFEIILVYAVNIKINQ